MALEIKELNKGMQYGDCNISLLMYADDIVFLAESESNLQDILRRFEMWCNRWQTNCNLAKTQIMHFRGKIRSRTEYQFSRFGHDLQLVSEYKYLDLGLVFDEFLT